MKKPITNERRKYFRIDDRVGVAYRKLERGRADYAVPSGGEQLGLLTALASYEKTITLLLGELQMKDRHMAELLQAMNNKTNAIMSYLQLDARLTQELACRIRQVNISACGMALTVDEEYDPDTELEFNLHLLPGTLKITCQARVIRVTDTIDTAGFYTQFEFSHMDPKDQEVLIQHIVQRQSSMLNSARAKRDLQ